jgi:hypothetical protein
MFILFWLFFEARGHRRHEVPGPLSGRAMLPGRT